MGAMMACKCLGQEPDSDVKNVQIALQIESQMLGTWAGQNINPKQNINHYGSTVSVEGNIEGTPRTTISKKVEEIIVKGRRSNMKSFGGAEAIISDGEYERGGEIIEDVPQGKRRINSLRTETSHVKRGSKVQFSFDNSSLILHDHESTSSYKETKVIEIGDDEIDDISSGRTRTRTKGFASVSMTSKSEPEVMQLPQIKSESDIKKLKKRQSVNFFKQTSSMKSRARLNLSPTTSMNANQLYHEEFPLSIYLHGHPHFSDETEWKFLGNLFDHPYYETVSEPPLRVWYDAAKLSWIVSEELFVDDFVAQCTSPSTDPTKVQQSWSIFVEDSGSKKMMRLPTMSFRELRGDKGEDYVVLPEHSWTYAKPATPRKLSKREKIVNEIISTETTYLNLLYAIEFNYFPLRNTKHVTPDLDVIFQNIETLHRFHRQFLVALKKNHQGWDEETSLIGNVFNEYIPYFKMYTAYVNFHSRFVRVQKKVLNTPFMLQFREKNRSLCENLDLPALLITPIQRLPRYKLLLEELLKKTPEDHVDYKNIEKALRAVENVNMTVNERVRENEKQLKARKILVETLDHPELAEHARTFEKEAKLLYQPNVTSAYKPCTIYLFNDLIYVRGKSKKKSFHHELRKGVWTVESNKDERTLNLIMEAGTSLKLKSETERIFHEWNSIFLQYEATN